MLSRSSVDAALLAALTTGSSQAARAVELHGQATRALEAIRLTELGARAGLVSQLTGIERAVARRLHRQLRGVPSPPGQLPYTAAWYVRTERRLLHTSLVWKLYRQHPATDTRAARALIDVYECYCHAVVEPVLDITHAAFVPHLAEAGGWEGHACEECCAAYLAPPNRNESRCPGCALYHNRRRRGRKYLRPCVAPTPSSPDVERPGARAR